MKAVLWIFVLIIAPFVIAKVDQWRKRGIGDTSGVVEIREHAL